jgi:hypothetical protein
MIKRILISSMTVSLMLFLLTACADEEQNNNATVTTEPEKPAKTERPTPPARPAPAKKEPRPQEDFQSAAVMSEAVDFSSPEQVTATLQGIQEKAGDEAASRLQSAIDYMLVYDLSVGRNQLKLYQKLNGKTPNEILAMAGR